VGVDVCVWVGGGVGGSDHGLGELDRHVAQAAEARHARGAGGPLGLGAEVGQGRVGRDACAERGGERSLLQARGFVMSSVEV
jgi:hypothetical protein